MASLDERIDDLYAVPLSTFVAERRAMAKQLPQHAAAIGALQKPTLAAWAVNQLFRTRRKTLDQLIRAAERVRDLQLQRLSGKPADLDAAERARRVAMDRAIADVTDLLGRAGEHTSGSTLEGVRETLETLPWTTLDGRLTRALKPTGLEALSALTTGGQVRARSPAPVVPIRPVPRADAGVAAAEKAREARTRLRQEIAALERDLREAKVAEQHARSASGKAAEAARRAEHDRAKADAALEQATAALEARRREARDAEQAAAHATRAREAIDQQLAAKERGNE